MAINPAGHIFAEQHQQDGCLADPARLRHHLLSSRIQLCTSRLAAAGSDFTLSASCFFNATARRAPSLPTGSSISAGPAPATALAAAGVRAFAAIAFGSSRNDANSCFFTGRNIRK